MAMMTRQQKEVFLKNTKNPKTAYLPKNKDVIKFVAETNFKVCLSKKLINKF